ncbi:MAG: P1 family peptidase [Spirochaetales bacterium]|nr:P1 family peptidase [Spirochaetales bacterium]
MNQTADSGAITDVPGIEVGHAQDLEAGRGCTVVICRAGAVAGVAAPGGAPGTRETDALRPENVVERAHAVLLSGGSAYGLNAAGGVMRYLEEQGIGYDIGVAVVPIVPAAVLNDLAFGDPKVRPDADMGYRACRQASPRERSQGNVGAGVGACIGRLAGNARGMVKGGVGTASLSVGELIVGAIVAVNCNGDVSDPETGEVLAGTLNPERTAVAGARRLLTTENEQFKEGFPTNTTIGVVATNAALSKATATRVAMMAQDGFARTIQPIHTLGDGDVSFCLSAGALRADVNRVGAIAAWVMAQAVVNAVRAAESLLGVPAYRDLAGKPGGAS